MNDILGFEDYPISDTGTLNLGEGERSGTGTPGAGFDSDFYLRHYPDVARAVGNGDFESAWEHWTLYGQHEGRVPNPNQLNSSEEVRKSDRDSLTGMAAGETPALQNDPLINGGAATAQTLQQGLQNAKNLLKTFATSPDFTAKMQVAFGNTLDVQKAGGLAQAWAADNFSAIPEVAIRSAQEINGAASAFAGATNTIYISREFLAKNAANTEAVAGVLLEEIGHAADKQLNAADAPGDEGAIFSALVRGEIIDDPKLQRLKAEDDTATITLDGQVIQIEQAIKAPYISRVGGLEGDTQVINLGGKQGTIQLSYRTFTIPDRLQLIYEGKVIFDSGFESTGGVLDDNPLPKTVEIPFSGNSEEVTAILTANRFRNDTLWNYTVDADIVPAATPPSGSNFERDQRYEFFAKDVAYKNWTAEGQLLRDSDFYKNQPEFQNLVGSYRVAKIFKNLPTNNNVTGFYALGLTSDNPEEATVLAIRGTEPPKASSFLNLADIFTDTNSNGVGFAQFAANRSEVINWLRQQKSPDITGHSLGGALTQLFAADFTSQGGNLGEIVTFNAPGIDDDLARLFQPNLAGDVTHYIVSGDLVSLAGEKFLPGTYQLYSYPGLSDYLTSFTLNKHLNPILVNGVGYDSTGVTNFRQPDPNPSDNGPFSTDVLNSPLFTYVDPEFFGFVVAANTAVNVLPLPQGIKDLPKSLIFRATLEATRRDIGREIILRGDQLNLNGGSGIGASLKLPNIQFPLLNLLDVQFTDMELRYESSPEDQFKLQGKLALPKLFNATANFIPNNIDPDEDNFIQITNKGVGVRGSLSVNKIPFVPGVWGVNEAKLSFDTINQEVKGEGTILIPTGIAIGGGLGVKNGQFNFISVKGDNLNYPIGTTGAFLQRISGQIDKIATPTQTEFSGGVGLTAGPEINVPFLNINDVSLLALDLDAKINSEQLTGIGKIKLIDEKIVNGQGNAILNWNKKFLSSTAQYSIFDGLIQSGSTLTADSKFNVTMNGGSKASIPSFFGGGTLADSQFLLSFSNDKNLSNDFASAWGTIGKGIFSIELGFTGFFDGRFDLTPRKVPQTNSFTVEPGTRWLLLNSNWENSNNNVKVRINAPDGTVFTENSFPSNKIAIADELTGENSKAVIVLNPEPGVWDINVTNPTGLGNVQYSAFRDSKAPTAQVTSPSTDITGQNVTINYNAFDPDSNAKVSLFYDTDNQGSDGILIANNLEEKDGNGSFTWNTEGIPTGDYYVYAMVVDDNNAPVVSYSPGKVRVTESADLSVTKTASADPVTVGSNLTYTIAVTNKGANNSRGVTLTDTLPEGVRFVSASVSPIQQSGNDLTFDLGNFNVGETKTVTVTVTPPATGTITGSARVTTKTFDADATNDVAILTTSVDPISTDLSVTTTSSPVSANLGDTLTYTFTVTNNGPTKATGVIFTDTLPSGVRTGQKENREREVVITSSKGSASETNGVITANLGDLNVGESATVTIAATSIAAGLLTNTVTVSSNEADSNSANNSFIQRTSVNPIAPAAADLELSATVDNPNPNVGDQVTFTLNLTNKGPGVASSIKVIDLLPSELSFKSATPEQGTYDPITGMWDVGNMRDNLSRTLQLTAEVKTGGPIITKAEVAAVTETDPDSTPGNNNSNEDDLVFVTLSGLGGIALDSEMLEYFRIMGIYPRVGG